MKGHVSGHVSVHHVSCGVLLGRSWCFFGDGSSSHSDDSAGVSSLVLTLSLAGEVHKEASQSAAWG